MKLSKSFLILLAVLIADFILITSNMHAIFDKDQYLFLYIITRVGILIFGIFTTRQGGNWLYVMLTVGYLVFSFIGVSILHLSYTTANI